MRNTYQETSLDAYKQVPIGRRQREVMQLFHKLGYNWNMTNQEIADNLGWSICRVTPRVKELRNKLLLERACTRTCTVTGFRANAWKLVKQ